MDITCSRRNFIYKLLYTGTITLGGAWMLGGCKSDKSDSEDKENENASAGGAYCDDLSDVSASEIEKRNKLAYVNESPIPDSRCGNCSLYIPPATENACGGCMLFKGPVRAEGYCTYWVPIT